MGGEGGIKIEKLQSILPESLKYFIKVFCGAWWPGGLKHCSFLLGMDFAINTFYRSSWPGWPGLGIVKKDENKFDFS